MQNNFLETPPKEQFNKSYDVGFLGRDLKDQICSDKDALDKSKTFSSMELMGDKKDPKYFKYVTSSSQNVSRKQETRRHHDFESSTQVTFSELNQPIPSVSPIKDTIKDYDLAKPPRHARPISASPNLFNDLESVLNQPDGFGFHSALSDNVVNVPAKTPEKLLTSVPPSVIMNKKNSLLFDSFEDIDNLTHEHSVIQPDNVQGHSAQDSSEHWNHIWTSKPGSQANFLNLVPQDVKSLIKKKRKKNDRHDITIKM